MATTDNPTSHPLDSYTGYRGLPPLVGLLSMKQAATEGLTVTESVERLKRLHWALKRLHGIFALRLTAMPVYELKMAFSLHAHYCAEHVAHLGNRIREMRQPPYGLDISPEPSLDIFFDEVLATPSTAALVMGLYEVAIPAVNGALESFLRDTSRLFDHPTYRAIRFAQVEFAEVREYADAAVQALITEQDRTNMLEWKKSLGSILAHAGGLDGTTVRASNSPFDPAIPPQPKTIMLFFKRMREIDVPEMMASILAETPGKPWEYYRDMTRQLWDEARHAMMGEVGFVSLGIDWRTVPFNFTWSRGLNTILTPLERHAVLFTIEQGLMPKKTGKEYEWEIAVASASRLSELIQDYDWADEIVHAKVGRDWCHKLERRLRRWRLAIRVGLARWLTGRSGVKTV
jgi:hypothetical protein